MARYGLTYTPPPAAGPTVTQTTRRYGPVDPAAASVQGYHPADAGQPPHTGPAATSGDMNTVLGAGLGADGKAAPGSADSYHGRKLPVGGCRGAAQADLTAQGGTGRDSDVAVGINYGGYQQSLSDPRVTAAFRMWSRCMKQKGFSYNSPLDADKDPRWEKAPRPSPDELTTATADAACKRQTNLVGVWYTVESAYEDVAIQQNQAQLTAARDADARMLAVANSVIAQGR
jgi:hypothetical protein